MGVRRLLAGRRRTKSNTRSKDVRLLWFFANSLVRRFEETGIYIDPQDRRDVSKQYQDKTVYLHSRMDVSGSSPQMQMLHTSGVHTRRQKQDSEQTIFDV